MKIAVLGIGQTGQAMAAYLLSKNHKAVLWDRSHDKVQGITQSGINISGLISGNYRPPATFNMEEAIQGAKYIFVMTVAEGHSYIAKQLSGKLGKNQRIVIFNGNWGAIEFYSELSRELKEKNCILTETGGMILLSDSEKTGVCKLKQIKNDMPIAGIPSKCAGVVAEELKSLFPSLIPIASVLETSINNSNPILHAPISLFNITRMENGEDYGFYAQAASRLTIRYAENADRERVAVAQAIGINGQSCLEILNGFWDEKCDNLFDAIKQNKTYIAGKGPKTTDYRYITEDLPFGIVPIIKIGRKYNVKMPYLEALIHTYSLLFERDFMDEGPDFNKISLEEIIV